MKINIFFDELVQRYKTKKELKNCNVGNPSITNKECILCKNNERCQKIEESKIKWVSVCPVNGLETEFLPMQCYQCLARHHCSVFKELS